MSFLRQEIKFNFKKLNVWCICISFFLAHPSFAQTEDELFDDMDVESSLSESLDSDLPESVDGESYLSDDSLLPMDEFPAESISSPTATENSDEITNDMSDVGSNDDLDSRIDSDVQSLSGPNAKPKDTNRVKFIKHPGQKQGLYKISSDGRYYYKVEESSQRYGLAVKGGAVILNQLENTETGVEFKDIYGTSAKPSFYVEYYWSYFKNRNVPRILKKARVKMGSGLLMATGTGKFRNVNYATVPARETYTLLAFPNFLGLHLAFEVSAKQLIVPYVTGAFEYLVGVELQNDNFARTKVLGQLGAHVGGGLAISLGWLDEMAKFHLDTEYGINQTFFTVELRQNIALQSEFDFTATFINAGIQFEF